MFKIEKPSTSEKFWLGKYQKTFEKARLPVVNRLIPPGKNHPKALDIGCGTGILTNIISEKGYAALGIDTNEKILNLARKRYPNCKFKAINALNSDLPNSFFHFVLAIEIIEHMEDSRDLLLNMRRVLKKDGVILFSTPNKLSLEGFRGLIMEKIAGLKWNAWDEEHKHVYTSLEFAHLLEQYFEVEKIVGYYYVPMMPSMKYDLVRKFGFDKMHYLSFWKQPFSKFGFITMVRCRKC